jgi:phosphoribosylamine-glycine ligase
MKFVLVSKFGEGLHLLWQIACEGNGVEAYLTEKGKEELWQGILPRAESLPLDREAIYIFDMSGNGPLADKLLRQGYYVIGGSGFADDIEFDREVGLNLMKSIDMKVPKSQSFKKCEDAAAFFRSHEGERFVFKPSGENLPCFLSHVPEEGEDITSYIEYVGKVYGKELESIEVQEFIEGVAISTEGWFDGQHFIEPFNHTIEKKKLFNDDLGPATGCAGNVVWTCEEDAITSQLKRLEPHLAGKYIGPIDINMIVNEKGSYGLEWTPRFGYDALPALLPLFNFDVSKFFSDIARHQFEGSMPLDEIFSAALRVTIPPYPEDENDIPGGLPLNDVDEKSDAYYFYEIMLEDERLVHSKGFGLLLCALAQNGDLYKSLEGALDVAESLSIPNKSYRTDLSVVISDDFEKWRSYGR